MRVYTDALVVNCIYTRVDLHIGGWVFLCEGVRWLRRFVFLQAGVARKLFCLIRYVGVYVYTRVFGIFSRKAVFLKTHFLPYSLKECGLFGIDKIVY